MAYVPTPFSIGYLNGQVLPLEDIRISPMDRGYLFGDSVYEVMPVMAGRVFRKDYHLKRIANGIASLKLPVHDTEALLDQIVSQLYQANQPEEDCAVYLQISRGNEGKRDLVHSSDPTPTVFAFFQSIPTREQRTAAMRLDLQEDIRWHRGQVKASTLLGASMSKSQATEKGYPDTLMHRDNLIGEATTSNFYAVIDGQIYTPPLADHILPGVTRVFLADILRAQGVTVHETELKVEDISRMSEAWLTSSLKGVTPIQEIAGTVLPGWEAEDSRYRYSLALYEQQIEAFKQAN